MNFSSSGEANWSICTSGDVKTNPGEDLRSNKPDVDGTVRVDAAETMIEDVVECFRSKVRLRFLPPPPPPLLDVVEIVVVVGVVLDWALEMTG